MNNCKYLTLENGLTVLIYIDKGKHTNHAELITFLGGSTNNYINKNNQKKDIYPGTAHLLEHYVCENSNNGNLLQVFNDFQVLNFNALTNNKITSYHFTTVNNFKECLGLIIDSVYNPIFSHDKLEKTKYAVFSEIRDANDNFSREVANTKVGNVFGIYNVTVGDSENIEKIDFKYLEEVYNCFYVPKNQFLVLAGNFDENEIIEYVNNIYSKFEFENNEKREIDIDKKEVVKKEDVISGDSLDEVFISFKIPTYEMNSFNKYKFDWYLNFFIESYFVYYSSTNEILKNKNIITGDINCGLYRLGGYSVIEVAAYTEKKDEFIDNIINIINNKEKLKKDDFEFAKKISKTNVSVRKDSISNYVMPVMDNYIEFGYTNDDTIDFINSLNFDEYVKIINSIDFSNYSILTIKGKNV